MAENRSFTPATQGARRAAPMGRGSTGGLDALSQGDNPQEDWGDPADEGATYSANHTRRPAKTEADRGQGKKTRAARKDQISRRG
jgi:hypothetical protein